MECHTQGDRCLIMLNQARVALIQMLSSSSVKHNLKQLPTFFAKAQEEGAALVMLPENFAFMGHKDTDKFQIAEEEGEGQIQTAISQLARAYKLWVIAGSIPLKCLSNRLRSSCLVYDDQGECKARYDKIHLFDVCVSSNEAYKESLTIEPGDQIIVVDTPVGRIGLSICYDIRFPELYRQLVLKGAELFAVPSAFTAETGKAHWEILLRARAIENLCYVLAPNQGGMHNNGRHTYGHSMVIEPWGNIINQNKNGAGIIVADIDLLRLRQLRQQFPCHEHHVLR